jgi:hypothetical protein
VKGLIVDVIEPLAMLALIGLVLVCRCRGSHKGFPDLCRHRGGADSSRRLNNAIVVDRSARSGYLWATGIGDVGPNRGRLEVGLEPLVPGSVAKHRCIGDSAGGRQECRERSTSARSLSGAWRS